MTLNVRRFQIVFLVLICAVMANLAAGQQPSIRSVRADSRTVGLYEKFALRIDLKATYDNPLDPDKIDIFFNDVCMVKSGIGCGEQAEARATDILKTDEFAVSIDLNAGNARASVWTCDFSTDYVKINADKRS